MRPIVAADRDELCELHRWCFSQEERWSASSFDEVLSGMGAEGLIIPGAGFILGRVIIDEAELLTLAVAPEARRQGHAQALMDRFLMNIKQRGALKVFLEVAENNTGAYALYRKSGFISISERKNYYPEGVTGLVMQQYL